ncbi:hypothetical protein SAMN05444162_3307 [Paenibacillaceae bacterium GAS479]|nr:hypothetical protein SAMN05444162_3307 [Paenibacillaceae bacterium GAS479]
MNVKQANISNFKGLSTGMILVLFILLIIVLAFTTINPSDAPEVEIASSIGYNVYNDIGSYDLVATALRGDFEPPPPPLHTIPSGSSYNFQVRNKGNAPSSAIVRYNIDFLGQSSGTVEINMVVTHIRIGVIPVPVADSYVTVQSSFVTGSASGKTIRIYRRP